MATYLYAEPPEGNNIVYWDPKTRKEVPPPDPFVYRLPDFIWNDEPNKRRVALFMQACVCPNDYMERVRDMLAMMPPLSKTDYVIVHGGRKLTDPFVTRILLWLPVIAQLLIACSGALSDKNYPRVGFAVLAFVCSGFAVHISLHEWPTIMNVFACVCPCLCSQHKKCIADVTSLILAAIGCAIDGVYEFAKYSPKEEDKKMPLGRLIGTGVFLVLMLVNLVVAIMAIRHMMSVKQAIEEDEAMWKSNDPNKKLPAHRVKEMPMVRRRGEVKL